MSARQLAAAGLLVASGVWAFTTSSSNNDDEGGNKKSSNDESTDQKSSSSSSPSPSITRTQQHHSSTSAPALPPRSGNQLRQRGKSTPLLKPQTSFTTKNKTNSRSSSETESLSFFRLSVRVFRLGRKLWQVTSLLPPSNIQSPLIVSAPFITAALAIAMLVVATAMDIKFALLISSWTNAMTEKDIDNFYSITYSIGWYLAAWLPVTSAESFLMNSLSIQLQHRFSHSLIERYFKSKAYFHVQNVPNAGVRTLEVGDWIKKTQKLTFKFFTHVMNLISYSTLLVYIGWSLFGTIAIFSLVVTVFAVYAFYPSMTKIVQKMTGQKRDLEYSLVRVHECRESIAFHNGGHMERSRIGGKFNQMTTEAWSYLYWLVGLGAFQFTVSRSTALIPYLVVAPLYFKGEISYGTIGMSARAFYYVKEAMMFFVGQFDNFAELSAATTRLQKVVRGLESCEARNESNKSALATTGGETTMRNSTNIAVDMDDVKLSTPTGAVLVEHLSFSISVGARLLITGRSGCGKSSLMRACAGLWPLEGGRIHVNVNQRDIGYMPQSSYFPMGSLREALVYPKIAKENNNDAKLIRALKDAQLESVLERAGGLDGLPTRWSEVLSMGEQQRLGFARVFVHRPSLLFADEATSALDMVTERILYQKLIETVSTVISIGHRDSLKEFHTHFLNREQTISPEHWTFKVQNMTSEHEQ